jgi:hypothetical protein
VKKTLFISISIVSLMSSLALANKPGRKGMMKNMPEITKEHRAKMATSHENMAACLRTDKEIKECRDALRADMDSMRKEAKGMMKGKMQEMTETESEKE